MNETKKGNAYLCFCHGMSGVAYAAIVDDIYGVRRFLVNRIFGEDDDEVQGIIDRLEKWNWRCGVYDAESNTYGLKITDVFKA